MLVYALLIFSFAYAHGIQVNTTEGVVEGAKAADGDYFVFYGIPYAGPTSGANRFKSPVPPPLHAGVLYANNSNVICAQPTTRGLVGVENCLTLSISTKNVTNTVNSTRPVFVFLNSEEYTTTNNLVYSQRRFVEEEIVFVTMNHRLSIFGFLCLGVEEAPGNAGLKDVIQGLKWIKLNIANFGGDPNNVVLVGHAAGAAMVDLLTLSPQIENLVHKAIALSGSGLAPWAVAYDPVGYAELLGNKLGYTKKDPAYLAKHLNDTDINVLQTFLTDFSFHNNTPLFAPCIENSKLSGSFLTEAPMNVLKSGNYSAIPFIYGYTTREGTLRAEEAIYGNWINLMEQNFTNFVPVDLKFTKNKTAEVASIRDFYFSASPINMGTIEDFFEFEGDTLVVLSAIKGAKERALTSKGEVRLMEFGYMGTPNNDWRLSFNQIALTGARHGAFLNYMFDYHLKDQLDVLVAQNIVKRFSAFARNWTSTATPSARSMSSWMPITNNSVNYLIISGSTAANVTTETFGFNPHIQRTSFWDILYDKYYVAPTAPSSSSVTLSCVLFVMLSQILIRVF